MARRGDVYRAVLSPVVGSEQSGTRPVVIVSRDAINATGTVFIIVPVTDRANKKHIYKSYFFHLISINDTRYNFVMHIFLII